MRNVDETENKNRYRSIIFLLLLKLLFSGSFRTRRRGCWLCSPLCTILSTLAAILALAGLAALIVAELNSHRQNTTSASEYKICHTSVAAILLTEVVSIVFYY